jgi:hypothetical protein
MFCVSFLVVNSRRNCSDYGISRPDDWDPEEFYDDRCDRIEAEKYGNKRIEYVPTPDAERG